MAVTSIGLLDISLVNVVVCCWQVTAEHSQINKQPVLLHSVHTQTSTMVPVRCRVVEDVIVV